ncbi:MAG: NAD-dependent epimerase/dehydratase family protein [Methylophilaceae bacterium]
MKILVTGADGFTGLHFVEKAVNHGHKVTALKANLNDVAALEEEVLLQAPEAVVHLAAISFVGHADVSEFYTVNVIGTLNLLHALAKLPKAPKSVLLASSANVYGNCETSPIAESQPPAPVNHYATSKLAMEHMARTYLDRLPLFFVRPFNYVGTYQSESFVIPKLVAHFVKKAPVVELGNINVEREFNDVRFVCDAYLALLNSFKTGETYNICTGKPVTLNTVIKLLTEISGHNIEISVNPTFVRANEIHRLCGDSSKLKQAVGNITVPTLAETLTNMVSAYD